MAALIRNRLKTS